VTRQINVINMSVRKQKQFIITRRRRATHVVDTRHCTKQHDDAQMISRANNEQINN
jgi:hypothetical protein